MNGLTPDRVTRPGAWRNSTRRSLKMGVVKTDPYRADDSPRGASGTRMGAEGLGRAVEMEVIPRLMVAYRSAAPKVETPWSPGRPDILEFSALVSSQRAASVWDWVSARLSDTTTPQALYLELLMPTANLILERWQADLCHFEEVALGMLNLQHVLHSLSANTPISMQAAACGRRALVLSAPCEQSMLGVFMVTEFYRCLTAEFFYRAGWDVWRTLPSSRPQLAQILQTQWFDVIDVASSCSGRLPQLSADIAQMRRSSLNAHVGLTVSGPAFAAHPELGAGIGADACAGDPRDTLARAESLAARREGQGSGVDREP